MNRAYVYMRCSGQGQVDGDTWDRQLAAVESYQVQHPCLCCVYREPGFSGAIQDRPVLAEMLLDLEENGIKTVIIEKLDRLARDVMVQEAIVRDLHRRGVEIVSISEPNLLSDDPTRKLIRVIMGAFAEYDREMIVARTRAARERIRARGERCEGRKAYGAHPDKPSEMAVLTRIQVAYATGGTFTHIAQALNSAGIKPRSGKLWFPSTVRRILKRA